MDMKCCLECGSTDITLRYGGKLGRIWICKKCGWQGRIIVDFPDESLKKMKMIEKGTKLDKKIKRVESMAKKSKKYY